MYADFRRSHATHRPHPQGSVFIRGLLLLLVVFVTWFPSPTRAQSDAAATIDPRRRTPIVEVFEQTRDSVVNIASTQVIEVRSPFGPGGGFFDDRFDLFFDDGGPRRRGRGRNRHVTRTSVGSGFVLHEAGYIVTNAHVVARTAERKAIFADGSEHEAEVVAIDEGRDLAILKIDPQGKQLRPIPLGISSDLMVGETVVAIGNPLGYQHTVTSGVVSALDRSLPVDQDHALDGLIQTDASINPGNSGGPLLNILGRLIGVNTAIRADAQNIGFAIPVDHLRELLPAMLDVERRYRIVTGLVVGEAATPEGVRVRVERVEPGSPAADAGLEATLPAVLEAVDGTPIHSVIDYLIALVGRAPGEVLQLTTRAADGRQRTVSLTLGERPRPDGAKLLSERLGLEAAEIEEEARQRGLRIRGLVITGIRLNGAAQEAGLEVGDVLLQIGRHQPTTLAEVGELLEPLRPGDEIDVAILRVQGRTLYRAATTLRVR